LNLFTEPVSPIVVTFDQSLDPASGNVDLDHFVLEYESPAGSGTWVEIPRAVELTQNCAVDLGSGVCPRPEVASVTVSAQGILPPNALCRVVVGAGVRDIGQVQSVAVDTVVATFTVDSAGAGGESDAFIEEFEDAANEDTSQAFSVPFAEWGPQSFGGPEDLAAPAPFPGADSNFDWTVQGSIVVDTSFAVITNTLGQQLQVTGGVANVHDFHVLPGAKVFGQGPNPLVINATGNVIIEGEVNVDGFNAANTGGLNTPYLPVSGAPGNCGGGEGGSSSPATTQSDLKGGDGFGPFPDFVPAGGGLGGHSSFGTGAPEPRRGGGGGGGAFSLFRSTSPLIPDPENPSGGIQINGRNGGPCTGVTTPCSDCVDLALPVNGGLHGLDVFTDADPTNNFFGRKKIGPASTDLLVGELSAPTAGQGGGGGGDAVQGSVCPSPQWLQGDRKGGAAGGGGGLLILRALGSIQVTSVGRLSARGGRGGHGESILFINPAGGGGGGASGGMIIVESATSITIGTTTGVNNRVLIRGDKGGNGINDAYGGNTVGRGGDGAIGLAQFHAPINPTTGFPTIVVDATNTSNPATGTPITVFDNSPPIGLNVVDAGNVGTAAEGVGFSLPFVAHILIPTFGPQSRARSKWIDTGFAFLGPLSSLGGPFYPWVVIPPSCPLPCPSVPNNSMNTDYPLGPTGLVRTDPSGKVITLPVLASGSVSSNDIGANVATIPGSIVPNPDTLHGDAFNPNTTQPSPVQTFTIVSASYDPAADETTIVTDPSEGPMDAVVGGGSTNWEVRPRFFRVHNGSALDTIPSTTAVRIQFEGADALDPMTGDPIGLVGPTPNLDQLAGKRLVRFTVEFDINAGGGVMLSSSTPRPRIPFFKIPLRF
jgi:hypothetical protein